MSVQPCMTYFHKKRDIGQNDITLHFHCMGEKNAMDINGETVELKHLVSLTVLILCWIFDSCVQTNQNIS